MKPLYQNIEDRALNNQNFSYCFEVRLKNNSMIFLTSSSKAVRHHDVIYYPYSGLNVKEAFFNDSAKDHVLLEGIFENKGINRETDLLAAEIKIYLVLSDHFYPFVSYVCTNYTKYNLNFLIKLEPETLKYNQIIVNKYSKTCRANFGDHKCSVNKDSYSIEVQILEILGNDIKISATSHENGYFTSGDAYIKTINFHAKIQSHSQGNIRLDRSLSHNIIHTLNHITLTVGCDKKFITCCNKFHNAVNFRGEPFIPAQDFLKVM